jgi:hypothetical protein
MHKRILILCTFVFLMISAISKADELKIRPHQLNPNGKRAVMKAELWTSDTKAVDTSNITLNGVAPIRTRVTPVKVIAFFSKADVLATLGQVQQGQTYTLSLSFSQNNSPAFMTADIKIVGKTSKKNQPQHPTGKP